VAVPSTEGCVLTAHLVLVLNAGSSSLKFEVLDPEDGATTVDGHLERIDADGFGAALGDVSDRLTSAGVGPADLRAVGHRVVHGGPDFTAPVLLDDDVVRRIEALVHLAPLHNPAAVEGIRRSREAYPDVPQVAVFDTAFFADLPGEASRYALDRTTTDRLGIQRYGMHGTSHSYVAHRAAASVGRPVEELDQIVLHLGNGASAAAIRGGRPVDTSMGFTPLEGLVMGTRAGDLDPGVLLHLLRRDDLDVDGLEDLLHHRSGLEGLAGRSDFRDLLAAVDAGDEAAATAYAVYLHRLRKYVGAYLAVLGGADVLTFTAGVGENVPRVREDGLAGLAALGIEVDPARNRVDSRESRIVSSDASAVTVLVVPTNEELAIARDAVALLG
jgi:acetate kinase